MARCQYKKSHAASIGFASPPLDALVADIKGTARPKVKKRAYLSVLAQRSEPTTAFKSPLC